MEIFQKICLCLFNFIIQTSWSNLNSMFVINKKKNNSKTVHIFYNLQNEPTFHSEEMLVNLVIGRECFVGLSIFLVYDFTPQVTSHVPTWCRYPEFGYWLNQTGRPMIYACSWPVYQTYSGMQVCSAHAQNVQCTQCAELQRALICRTMCRDSIPVCLLSLWCADFSHIGTYAKNLSWYIR